MTPEESEDAKISAEAAAPAGNPDGGAEGGAARSTRPGDADVLETAHPAARKLVPPPKPARDSRPSMQPTDVQPAPSPSALTPRAPMIVVGEPSQPLHREGAQAWTRPASEPPRQSSMPPWGNLTPRREPTPSVGVLRSRLEAREKSNPPREWTQPVSPIPSRPAPPPTMHASPPPEGSSSPPPLVADKAGPALGGLGNSVEGEDSEPPPSVVATPLPVIHETPTVPRGASNVLALMKEEREPAEAKVADDDKNGTAKNAKPKTQAGPTEAEIADAFDPDAPTPVPAGGPKLPAPEQGLAKAPSGTSSAAGDSDPEALRADAATPPPEGTTPDGELLPPRPKSGPARLRSGPPRPRATSPDFGGPGPASSSPPRPTPAGAGRVEVPPPPKVPSFTQGVAHVTSPALPEEGTERRSEPPVPHSAIAVMKIIAVGDPAAEPPIELEGDFEETEDIAPAPARVEAEVATDGAVQPTPVGPDELEELPADEVAPDSSERRTPVPIERRTPIPEIPIEEAIPVVEDLEAMSSATPAAREIDVRPPPPPRRTPKTPALPKAIPQAKRRQKRAWFEDIFGEDFVRANFRLSERQIRREVDFIEESLGVAAGGVVLDLGCGAGHHAVELASRGYGVVGYDLSLYQLALAAEVAQERAQRLNFLQGDMREMAFEEMFDGIFSWNTSFGYFEEDKNQMVAERVFRALRPGGMFLIDVVNRDFAAVQSPCSLWYEGESCVCMDDMSLDFITSRLRVKRSVILDDGRTRECLYSIRLYSMHELGKLLHSVGFRVSEASGHPSTPGVFFGEYSPRIIMLAQKP